MFTRNMHITFYEFLAHWNSL